MKEGILSVKTENKPEVIFIPVPYDVTASGRKGAVNGPKAILEMLEDQIEDYDRYLERTTTDHVNLIPKDALNVKDMKPENMVKTVKKHIDKVKESKQFPIILGGDHSISIGVIKSLAEKYKDLTVLQIDAHLDLRDDDSDYSEDPSKYAHACTMRRARDYGCKTVQVGIRMFYSGEMDYVNQEGIKDNIFTCPIKADMDFIIDTIQTDDVYLTLDVDGLDPSFMPATGTPVQGGLDWYWTMKFLKKVFEKKNVVAADIVEVAPTKDNPLTERGAAQLAFHMAGFKFPEE